MLCQARIEQTERELKSLQCEVEGWVTSRQQEDRQKQYVTQLGALKEVLFRSLARVRDGVDHLTAADGPGIVYPACREWENCLVLARRVWAYYRDKFDQRKDPVLKPVLAAADEVVWSCYAEVFRNAQMVIPSAPLPYIEPEYTPLMIARTEPPAELRPETRRGTDVLKEFLEKMPFPVVALPPSCVQSPWQLIYLGHETGHHLQYDLAPDWQLVGGFRKQLTNAVPGADVGVRWGSWNQEVFADAFSVVALGSWAALAMIELELAGPDAMVQRRGDRSQYPPVAVRLAFLAQLVTALGGDGEASLKRVNLDPEAVVTGAPLLDGHGIDLRKAARLALEAVPQVVQAVRQYDLEGRGRLEDLCGWQGGEDFQPDGLVDVWSRQLIEWQKPTPESSVRAPRLVAAAGVAAWSGLADQADARDRKEKRKILREHLLTTIVACREEGTRAAETRPVRDLDALGDELGAILVGARRKEGESE